MDGADYDYVSAHLDLGVRLNFRDETKKARPFLKGGYSGVGLVWEDFLDSGEDLTSTGSGPHVGGGVAIFFGRKFALDIEFTFLNGSLSEVEFDGETESIDVSIRSTRFDVGATWFLGGGQ